MNGGGNQLGLGDGAVQNLDLFSDHFLRERLPAWTEYRLPDVRGPMAHVKQLWEAEREGLSGANEDADHMVYDLYELSGDHRALIDTEYGG